MSIASAGIAEGNNKWKNDLVKKLKTAVGDRISRQVWEHIDYVQAINDVIKIIDELEKFNFTE
jgi:hypothetical protein